MTMRTAIAVSGGIDSLTAAYTLKKQGLDVFGLHFLTGFGPLAGNRAAVERRMADIGRQAGIAVEIVDLSTDFQAAVVDYFTATYRAGRTPNPCMVCNPKIKFGRLLEQARRLGADTLATGHYARLATDADGGCHLHRGADPRKDQSYFLARLTPAQLAQARFPLGDTVKTDVQRRARDRGLSAVTTGESQDICFVQGMTYSTFLEQQGLAAEPGPIVTADGREIGRHPGLHLYTIGQRRGINCPAARPYYVLALDRPRNRLVVGAKEELLRKACRVVDINWIQPPPTGALRVDTRVRYRHRAAPSCLTPDGPGAAHVAFDAPQEAVTPGQGAVFYQGDEVIGGGWIASS